MGSPPLGTVPSSQLPVPGSMGAGTTYHAVGFKSQITNQGCVVAGRTVNREP